MSKKETATEVAAICILILANTFAVTKALAQELTYEDAPISPVVCEINFSDKIPSCAINFRAKKGDIVIAEFYKHKELSEYEDSILPNIQNYDSEPDGFNLNPIASTYEKDGSKQFRLMYTGSRANLDTSKSIYGRLVFTKKGVNGGVDEAQNISVHFITGPNQKHSNIKGSFIKKNGNNYLQLKNSGNGTLAIGELKFDGKIIPMYANVLPNSTDNILIKKGILPAKKSVTVYDKVNGKEIEVTIE